MVDRLDPNTTRIMTDQDHKSKFKTHSKKQQQNVSEATEFSFLLLSQGSEVSKGFIYKRCHFNDYYIILAATCTSVVALVRSDTSTKTMNNFLNLSSLTWNNRDFCSFCVI